MSGITDDDLARLLLERVTARKDHLRAVRLALLAKLADIDKFIELIESLFHHHPHPRRIVLQMPTLRNMSTGESIMAAYSLKTNVVATFPITLANPAGGFDAAQPGDVFTVVSSDPTNLNAVVGADATSGAPNVSVNWLHTTSPMLTGVGISITDSAGNTADMAETFDMVPPAFVADQIGIDIANVVETPQPNAV